MWRRRTYLSSLINCVQVYLEIKYLWFVFRKEWDWTIVFCYLRIYRKSFTYVGVYGLFIEVDILIDSWWDCVLWSCSSVFFCGLFFFFWDRIGFVHGRKHIAGSVGMPVCMGTHVIRALVPECALVKLQSPPLDGLLGVDPNYHDNCTGKNGSHKPGKGRWYTCVWCIRFSFQWYFLCGPDQEITATSCGWGLYLVVLQLYFKQPRSVADLNGLVHRWSRQTMNLLPRALNV